MMHESSPLSFPDGFLSINRLVISSVISILHQGDEFRRGKLQQESSPFTIMFVIRFNL